MQTALKLKIGHKKNYKLIRAGVELKTREYFKNLSKQEKLKSLQLGLDVKIVFSAANLKPQKNPLDMVLAAKTVIQKIPNAVFLYLGEGELKAKTQELIETLKLKNNFKLLGHREDVFELLYIADVFALSSLWEGLPMAVAEALSMQVPCVCYNVGGIGEIVEDGQNGYLVNAGDYKMLAKRIINALENKIGVKPNSVQEFDIKTMLEAQQEIYLGK
jgi:glycosyltransferase involved in cell wall biosynthesis